MPIMKFSFPAVAAAILLPLMAVPASAQEDDIFAFIPPGGRSLLTHLDAEGLPPEDLQDILTGQRSEEEWRSYLQQRQGALPAMEYWGDVEIGTLASYLAHNMPASGMPAEAGPEALGQALPPDGRDLALTFCQSCHIITVTITQDRSKAAWLGTMHKPSHIEIDLTEDQREALAEYLVLNAAIPIDLVPEDLRAGGASY